MISIYDIMQDERRYGYVLDKRYDWLNMLIKMEKKNPRRFKEFKYSKQTFYHYLDRIQQEQNIYD
jgi:23S rRNA maturation-related 3'-5' exoribonuclease YhaM